MGKFVSRLSTPPPSTSTLVVPPFLPADGVRCRMIDAAPGWPLMGPVARVMGDKRVKAFYSSARESRVHFCNHGFRKGCAKKRRTMTLVGVIELGA
jgi:hypothetical protein